ncbi:uncharacterized protein SOCG_01881 [Schizosaccharomyces octosporus yFS286]|uniref:Uncharacterized protein n=1 Tax=Schizosaccharomyces octosporus (strain yFS286) TaxID=483514 RepID=S9PR77_SCHOY|nr:uncharacterized protein SOCG_01881 [Schizosaccharomyces octosporus yFS286]EPX71666.1 hypothetical protein SOCG_01881 [Schizosaccharomyces octosporus yFS286]
MTSNIQKYVKNCQRHKFENYQRYSPLQSIPVAETPFRHYSMDFVTGLPMSKVDPILAIEAAFGIKPIHAEWDMQVYMILAHIPHSRGRNLLVW